MKKRKNSGFIILLLILVTAGFLVFSNQAINQEETYENITSLKVANWNLQIFGDSKASKPELMEFYSKTIKDYDIIFIQEIRDNDGDSFVKLCGTLDNYSCLNSSRAGRSSSKEQYGVIYKNEIEITSFKDFNPDNQDRWERPPIEVNFKIDNYNFTAYNIHTRPDDVPNEMDYLYEITKKDGNVIVLGDLNADCSYYNNEKEEEFDDWNWIIKDDEDTTVSSTDCAYDRIILNQDLSEEFSSYGIYNENITSQISDHYLVWVEASI